MIFTNIAELPVDRVYEKATLAQTLLRELKPNADLSKGTALYDLAVRPISVMFSLTEENIARARNAGSLLRISQDPSLADSDMVDEILSNYRTARKQGSLAAGLVTIAISDNRVTAIPRGTKFTSGGYGFYTTDSFIGVPSEEQVSSATDRVIRSIGGGQYGFDVNVEAEATGVDYSLVSGDMLAMESPPSNYVSSWAAQDFVKGASEETTTELIERMPQSLANRTPGNRTNIFALLQQQNSDVREVSIVGYGDPEMTRDKENLFGISYGGKLDVYTQTAPAPLLDRRTVSAVLVNASTKKWQIFLGRDAAAGVYKIEAVVPQSRSSINGSLAVSSEARVVDNSGTVPHTINSVAQAAFSRFQTITLEFTDPFTDTADLTPMVSTQDYYVDVRVMPGIADLQDNVLDAENLRNPRYDDIIKAPVPCFVSVSCTVRLKSGDRLPAGVSQAVAERINGLGFRNRLSSAYVVDAIQGLLGRESYVAAPVDLLGEVIHPATGASVLYRSDTELVIPTNAEDCISADTLMFFCDASSVEIYQQAV